jgi:hypothetical protein
MQLKFLLSGRKKPIYDLYQERHSIYEHPFGPGAAKFQSAIVEFLYKIMYIT